MPSRPTDTHASGPPANPFTRELAFAHVMTRERYIELHGEYRRLLAQMAGSKDDAGLLRAELEQVQALMDASPWTPHAQNGCVEAGIQVHCDLLGYKKAVAFGGQTHSLEQVVAQLLMGQATDLLPMLLHAFGCDYEVATQLVFGGNFKAALEMLLIACDPNHPLNTAVKSQPCDTLH